MFYYLNKKLGARWAICLLSFTYAAMVLAILYCVFEPQAQLHYLAL